MVKLSRTNFGFLGALILLGSMAFTTFTVFAAALTMTLAAGMATGFLATALRGVAVLAGLALRAGAARLATAALRAGLAAVFAAAEAGAGVAVEMEVGMKAPFKTVYTVYTV
jgi:hypothetical protein